jgi:hypothetical protein
MKKLKQIKFWECLLLLKDHLCGLVVRVPGYRSRDPGFDSGLEWGPLSLVRITEELYE